MSGAVSCAGQRMVGSMSKRCRLRFFRRAILLLLSVAALTAAACTSDTPAPSGVTPSPTTGGEATAQPPAAATPAAPVADDGVGAPARSSDTEALTAVYDALDGANWDVDTNWLSDAPLGEWHGVTTDETGRVTGLDLSGNALAGSFPGEIANLTGLTVLNLADNGINGTVSAALSELTKLEVLDLSGNELGVEGAFSADRDRQPENPGSLRQQTDRYWRTPLAGGVRNA